MNRPRSQRHLPASDGMAELWIQQYIRKARIACIRDAYFVEQCGADDAPAAPDPSDDAEIEFATATGSVALEAPPSGPLWDVITAVLAERAAGAKVVPKMLGGDGDRRYFLAFQTPAELRSNGGLIGNFAEITYQNGDISLTRNARDSGA